VVLLKKLRAEQMFDSVEALREQMERDILSARNYFKNKNKPVLT
jgi:FAD synthase